MSARQFSKEYITGVKSFMKFVVEQMGATCNIRCPCKQCMNLFIRNQITVETHLLVNGIDQCYTTWFHHGEPLLPSYRDRFTYDNVRVESDEDEDGLYDMLHDLGNEYHLRDTHDISNDDNETYPRNMPKYLEALIEDSQTKLYPGCTKMS